METKSFYREKDDISTSPVVQNYRNAVFWSCYAEGDIKSTSSHFRHVCLLYHFLKFIFKQYIHRWINTEYLLKCKYFLNVKPPVNIDNGWYGTVTDRALNSPLIQLLLLNQFMSQRIIKVILFPSLSLSSFYLSCSVTLLQSQHTISDTPKWQQEIKRPEETQKRNQVDIRLHRRSKQRHQPWSFKTKHVYRTFLDIYYDRKVFLILNKMCSNPKLLAVSPV